MIKDQLVLQEFMKRRAYDHRLHSQSNASAGCAVRQGIIHQATLTQVNALEFMIGGVLAPV
jgi:hypothetical protein